jgi:hypothetical protein
MEGQKVQVCLITEGLGNRRDMNFYGPEAIDSAPAVFEGAHCFLNHPSYTEERDIPERRVQDMCGYFKNVHVDMSEGVRSVVGELHFDLSETGRMGYDKTCTALHYQTEFPGSDKEYVGLSVNANGNSEPRDMTLDGETVTANYVTQFTDAMSCDIVTLPARGGKFLTLVENAIGANIKNKEVRTMIVKRLQATQSALKEAMASAKTDEEKKPLSTALRNVESLIKDVLESQSRRKNKESETETEADADAEESEDESETEAEDAGGGDPMPKPGHKLKKTVSTTVQHTADGATADDEEEEDESESEKESETYESNRLAVKQLIQESGLKPAYFDVKELARKGLKEAKAEIARVRRISEANAKEMLEVVAKVSPSHAAKLNESGKSGGASSNNDLFAGCTL